MHLSTRNTYPKFLSQLKLLQCSFILITRQTHTNCVTWEALQDYRASQLRYHPNHFMTPRVCPLVTLAVSSALNWRAWVRAGRTLVSFVSRNFTTMFLMYSMLSASAVLSLYRSLSLKTRRISFNLHFKFFWGCLQHYSIEKRGGNNTKEDTNLSCSLSRSFCLCNNPLSASLSWSSATTLDRCFLWYNSV